jgi:hypothetical protein
MSEKRDLASAIGGPRAFECPKTSATLHEAGLCSVGAVQGERPSKATIWPIIEHGREQWIGRTYGLPRWRVDDRTPAAADLQHAQSELAGVVSEMLFDPDFRLASPVDEIVRPQGIVLTAATKLRRDVQQLWLETLVSVATTRTQMSGSFATSPPIDDVSERRLAYFLQSIGGPHGGS